MSALASPGHEGRDWSLAAGAALAAHAGVLALVLLWARPAVPPVPEPVVLVELPPEPAPGPADVVPQTPDQPQPQIAERQPPTPLPDMPPARLPVPADAVTLPPPAPVAPRPIAASAAPSVVAPSAAPAAPSAANGDAPGSDPRAKKQEADYFALVSAHLNRRKTYPVEARQARQQGVVTVRFTVDRQGNVSGASIKRSSGHAILDDATLALLQRVAPLPRMPASMQRDTITLSLPIDYSLRTN